MLCPVFLEQPLDNILFFVFSHCARRYRHVFIKIAKTTAEMCRQRMNRFICCKCRASTRQPTVHTDYCLTGRAIGRPCAVVVVQDEVWEEPACPACSAYQNLPQGYPVAPQPPYPPMHISATQYAYLPDARGMPPAYTPAPAYSPPPPVLQAGTRNGDQRVWVDSREQYYQPGVASTGASATARYHAYQPQNNAQTGYQHQNPPPAYHQPSEHPRAVTYPLPAYDRDSGFPSDDVQRALARSLEEMHINGTRLHDQDRRLSQLEGELRVERERVQLERERRQAEWERFSAEKEACVTNHIRADSTPSCLVAGVMPKVRVVTDKAPRRGELWINEIRKINGRLTEHRRRLKPGEYEVVGSNGHCCQC